MKPTTVIFYAAALALHAVVLFALKPSAPLPPKLVEKTFIDVALTAPPQPELPKPLPIPPPEPPTEIKPEPKPEPIPIVKPEMTLPEPKPEPPPPPPAPKPAVIPPPPVLTPEYVSIIEPKYARRAEPIYPTPARRQHQQGIVALALFINELGELDKVEILKSSGFPLLDNAAVNAMRQSRFEPALSGKIQVRSRAEVKIVFRLE